MYRRNKVTLCYGAVVLYYYYSRKLNLWGILQTAVCFVLYDWRRIHFLNWILPGTFWHTEETTFLLEEFVSANIQSGELHSNFVLIIKLVRRSISSSAPYKYYRTISLPYKYLLYQLFNTFLSAHRAEMKFYVSTLVLFRIF